MIVYGDHARELSSHHSIDGLRHSCDGTSHASLVTLLIETGKVAQGILDARFHTRGFDEEERVDVCCSQLLLEAARLVVRSRSGESSLSTGRFQQLLDELSAQDLPDEITQKEPEGFAFYALYPETYAAAAEAWRARFSGPLVAIGLRSIGTSLAAVVAAASGSDVLPVTVRPVGHPFHRELRLGPVLEQRLLSHSSDAHYAIVDEGPGLSGSSFGAVGSWLESRGVPAERIHLFPSHSGEPGAQASESLRARWRASARSYVSFEEEVLQRRRVLGTADRQDLSGGQWRSHRFASPQAWPPVNMMQERRKYLLVEEGRPWLAKFAGLGRIGEEKLAQARSLADAGFTPQVRELRHGFLVETWLPEARPLRLGENISRGDATEWIARYLSFRATHFPVAPEEQGATPEALVSMAAQNTAEALGEEWRSAAESLHDVLPLVEGRRRPIKTDGRMHLWEWLVLSGGRLLKTDALDHCAAHDCIGAQDVAWDVVGASVELGLTADEVAGVERALEATGLYRSSPEVRRSYLVCYLAFQAGSASMASSAHAFDPEEQARLQRASEQYAERLRLALASRD